MYKSKILKRTRGVVQCFEAPKLHLLRSKNTLSPSKKCKASRLLAHTCGGGGGHGQGSITQLIQAHPLPSEPQFNCIKLKMSLAAGTHELLSSG